MKLIFFLLIFIHSSLFQQPITYNVCNYFFSVTFDCHLKRNKTFGYRKIICCARDLLLVAFYYVQDFFLRSPSSVADNYCIMFSIFNTFYQLHDFVLQFAIFFYSVLYYYSNEYNLINNKMNLVFKLLGLIFVPTSFRSFFSFISSVHALP